MVGGLATDRKSPWTTSNGAYSFATLVIIIQQRDNCQATVFACVVVKSSDVVENFVSAGCPTAQVLIHFAQASDRIGSGSEVACARCKTRGRLMVKKVQNQKT